MPQKSASTPANGVSPDDIAHVIRNAIADGLYAPGERLSQVELAERFAVSRIPLREALRTLVSEGLLEHDQRRGTAVTALNRERIKEIYELRALIEPSFATEIVRNISRADLEDLERRVDEIERTGASDPDHWSQENFQMHLEMYRLARLPIRYDAVSRLYYLLEPYSRMYVHNSGGRPRAESEHRDMIAALRAGDAAALEAAILAHVLGGHEGLLEQANDLP
ncbi:GntR family transcriptional regulator [Leucobacter japonicus]|uniref:GntR family transcriptional regulator n=1 Tax=Leucobacter japonicus TaxID=1461259 RepID=UPI0006A7603E|nr:GntR family transcriptional regulator [Leucobacter japonicus]